MGWWTFKNVVSANVPTPAAGSTTQFVDDATGEPSYKGGDGITRTLKGTGFTVNGRVPTYADLPTGLTSGDAGKAYVVDADSLAYIWDGTSWPADGDGEALTGPQGPAGTDGTDGQPAYTTTSADFVQPAEGASVQIAVAATSWLAVGAPLYVVGGGFYTVASIQSATLVTITSLAGVGNTVAGSTIASGAMVVATGKRGATGDDGADANLLAGRNDQIGTAYMLALADANTNVRLSNAAAIVVTIPAAADVPFPANTVVYVSQGGAGAISVAGASGVTVNNPNSAATAQKGDWLALVNVGTDEWDVV